MMRVGAWLFRHRTVIPIPLALAILATPASRAQPSALVGAGAVLVAIGEAIRLWGVRHIGAISRTRMPAQRKGGHQLKSRRMPLGPNSKRDRNPCDIVTPAGPRP